MNRQSTRALGAVLLLLVVLLPLNTNAPTTTPAPQPSTDWLQTMTTEEKVGQLFLIHMHGKSATEAAAVNQALGARHFQEAIEKYHVGGFILFPWAGNFSAPLDTAALKKLTGDLQAAAGAQRVPVPLLIGVDQEGGTVARLGPPVTQMPAAGNLKTPEEARRLAEAVGADLRALGFNLNFSPVLDVARPGAYIGSRSFGGDPTRVTALGLAEIAGYQAQGVAAVAKHFPGHGATGADSHGEVPVLSLGLKELDGTDLPPFRSAITAGVEAIMAGHLAVPALDPSGRPATYSRAILTDLLRGELGYDGVIITDSLLMAGAKGVPPERAPVEALLAGADLLLMPPNLDVAYRAVLQAVQSGEISQERLDASVRRILTLKRRLTD